MARPWYILPVIVLAQFAGTSLWFAGNAVLADLPSAWGVGTSQVSAVTTAVQVGFIAGTLVFALLAFADRYSPRDVFMCSALLGAMSTAALLVLPPSFITMMVSRFATGFFLAGIYPVSMKIAASWYEEGLGRALGYSVGALVLGTAFPHLLRALGASFDWQLVLLCVCVLAVAGGLLFWRLVPDGPHLPRGTPFDPRALVRAFRASAFGYFGHMWELYAFWAFVPLWLAAYWQGSAKAAGNVAWWTFCIIAVGAIGCVAGGVLSRRFGSARVAAVQLAVSGVGCLLSPWMFTGAPMIMAGFLLLWGIAVVGDSPQFSALNAQTAPPEFVGSALTLVNSIGFLVTVLSVQLMGWLWTEDSARYLFVVLAIGPALGLLALKPALRR